MIRLFLIFILLSLPALAREKLQGWCQEGNKTVTTSGVVSTTLVQRSYPSCTVTVYNSGTLTLSTIYSDNVGTPKANPFTASAGGIWFFYAANGRFDVAFSGGGITTPFTLGDFLLADNTSVITSINSQTGPTITIATGTAGANFNITAAANVITLNIPDASAANRGLLTAANFNTFNAKESPLTFNAPLSRTANAVSLTIPLTILQGGTGQTTANTAFNALAPSSTQGDLIVRNATVNTRLPIGASSGLCLKTNLALANRMEWVACVSAPLGVSSGGTGATTLTGSLVGNGTSAFTAVAASSPLQFYRRQPNVSATTYQFTTVQYLSSADFDFPSQAPGGTLTAAVGASITMTPCPLGLNGADTAHYIYISGGVGSAEAVLITGGTCTSGASTGTVTFTPANNHSGAWVVTSATQGIQEAICYLPASDNAVRIPAGTITLNGNVGYCGETNVHLLIANGVTFAGSGSMPSSNVETQVTTDHRNGTSSTPGGSVPACKAYVVPSTNAAFIAAATTADVTLFELPAQGKIAAVTVKHSAQFSDGGGAMTDVSVSVGDSSSTTAYTTAWSIGEVTAAGNTVFQDTTLFKSTTFVARDVLARFTAAGANFGNGAATSLTGGSVSIWACWVVLP
jgi:hypothetical protein